jgi:hypothetical protein
MLTKSDRSPAQRMATLHARAWAVLAAPAIPFRGLATPALLELMRVAHQRRLPEVLLGAFAELARRLDSAQPQASGADEFARQLADLEARVIGLEEGATRAKRTH